VTIVMIRFEFDSLTRSMKFALSWLIEQGGATSWTLLLAGAGGAGKAHGILVTRATVTGLVRRGHLEESDDFGTVQIGRWAVVDACRFTTNPHPVPVMQARAEPLAHRENADRITATAAARNEGVNTMRYGG
jgi:hypothetical protein